MGFCCKILSLNDLIPSRISRPGTHCLYWQRANARANLWWRHEPFPGETSIALPLLKALCWKSWGRKKVLVMLGYHSIQRMLSIRHDKSDFGRNSPLTERRTSSANHLFTLHTAETWLGPGPSLTWDSVWVQVKSYSQRKIIETRFSRDVSLVSHRCFVSVTFFHACWSQGSHSNSAREISRALFARDGVGRHVVLRVCYTKLSWLKTYWLSQLRCLFYLLVWVSHKCVIGRLFTA